LYKSMSSTSSINLIYVSLKELMLFLFSQIEIVIFYLQYIKRNYYQNIKFVQTSLIIFQSLCS
jgi:hypothetical protein